MGDDNAASSADDGAMTQSPDPSSTQPSSPTPTPPAGPGGSPSGIANARRLLGPALVVIGAVLAIGFPDLKFIWFEGRPLGILLVILGVWELFDTYRRGQKD